MVQESTTIQALTQAAQALTAAANQMMQVMQGIGGGTIVGLASPTAQINIWEDDPFSEATPPANPPLSTPVLVNVPSNDNRLLQTQLTAPQPAPARYAPGTANFRYWTAAEALARGINFWAPLLPGGTRWSTNNPMQVTLVAGQDLNAFYSRQLGGLRFYQRAVRTITVFSGESPDVVCHELGHAILDALKPQLYNADSIEVAAFHESFGDMSSILSALQLQTLREKVLNETNGQLNVNSRLSRLAEQLGWAIRQLSPTAVDADCLRNAANRFFYQRPALLPPSAPASQLTSQPHSFSRVFTGAFLDALARMLKVMGVANDPSLLAVSLDLGQLLVDGIYNARIVPRYFSQVAANMIQADQARNRGRYRSALSSAFIQHGVLSPAAVAALARAPVPQPVMVPAGASGMVGLGGFGGGAGGNPMLLAYNGGDDDGYQRGPEDAPELPISPVSTEFGITFLVHAPEETERFTVAPAAFGGLAEAPAPEQDAHSFVEDLIQLGRVDFGLAAGVVPAGFIAPSDERVQKTHVLMETPEGWVLKRVHFDCGFSCYH